MQWLKWRDMARPAGNNPNFPPADGQGPSRLYSSSEVGDFVLTVAREDVVEQALEFVLADEGRSIRVRRGGCGPPLSSPADPASSWPLPGLPFSADVVAAVGNCRVTPDTAKFLLTYLRASRRLYTLALRPGGRALLDGVDIFGGIARPIAAAPPPPTTPHSFLSGKDPYTRGGKAGASVTTAAATAPWLSMGARSGSGGTGSSYFGGAALNGRRESSGGSASASGGGLPIFGGLLFKLTGEAKLTRKGGSAAKGGGGSGSGGSGGASSLAASAAAAAAATSLTQLADGGGTGGGGTAASIMSGPPGSSSAALPVASSTPASSAEGAASRVSRRRRSLMSLIFGGGGTGSKAAVWTPAFYVLDSDARVMRRYRAEDAPAGSSLHSHWQPAGASPSHAVTSPAAAAVAAAATRAGSTSPTNPRGATTSPSHLHAGLRGLAGEVARGVVDSSSAHSPSPPVGATTNVTALAAAAVATSSSNAPPSIGAGSAFGAGALGTPAPISPAAGGGVVAPPPRLTAGAVLLDASASAAAAASLSPASRSILSRSLLPTAAPRDVLRLDAVTSIDVITWWDGLPELPASVVAAARTAVQDGAIGMGAGPSKCVPPYSPPRHPSAAPAGQPTTIFSFASAAAASSPPSPALPVPIAAAISAAAIPTGGASSSAASPSSSSPSSHGVAPGSVVGVGLGNGDVATVSGCELPPPPRPQLLLLTCADGSSRHLLAPTLGATWTWMSALATITHCNVTPAAQTVMEETDARRMRRLSRALGGGGSIGGGGGSNSSSSASLRSLLAPNADVDDDVAAAAAAMGDGGPPSPSAASMASGLRRSGSSSGRGSIAAAAVETLPLIVDADSSDYEEEAGGSGSGSGSEIDHYRRPISSTTATTAARYRGAGGRVEGGGWGIGGTEVITTRNPVVGGAALAASIGSSSLPAANGAWAPTQASLSVSSTGRSPSSVATEVATGVPVPQQQTYSSLSSFAPAAATSTAGEWAGVGWGSVSRSRPPPPVNTLSSSASAAEIYVGSSTLPVTNSTAAVISSAAAPGLRSGGASASSTQERTTSLPAGPQLHLKQAPPPIALTSSLSRLGGVRKPPPPRQPSHRVLHTAAPSTSCNPAALSSTSAAIPYMLDVYVSSCLTSSPSPPSPPPSTSASSDGTVTVATHSTVPAPAPLLYATAYGRNDVSAAPIPTVGTQPVVSYPDELQTQPPPESYSNHLFQHDSRQGLEPPSRSSTMGGNWESYRGGINSSGISSSNNNHISNEDVRQEGAAATPYPQQQLQQHQSQQQQHLRYSRIGAAAATAAAAVARQRRVSRALAPDEEECDEYANHGAEHVGRWGAGSVITGSDRAAAISSAIAALGTNANRLTTVPPASFMVRDARDTAASSSLVLQAAAVAAASASAIVPASSAAIAACSSETINPRPHPDVNDDSTEAAVKRMARDSYMALLDTIELGPASSSNASFESLLMSTPVGAVVMPPHQRRRQVSLQGGQQSPSPPRLDLSVLSATEQSLDA